MVISVRLGQPDRHLLSHPQDTKTPRRACSPQGHQAPEKTGRTAKPRRGEGPFVSPRLCGSSFFFVSWSLGGENVMGGHFGQGSTLASTIRSPASMRSTTSIPRVTLPKTV